MTSNATSKTSPEPPGLIASLASPALDALGEGMWVDVIRRMDEVYSELLRNEADLERKNAELEDAQAFISSVFASVSDALIVCDELLIVREANAAFERLVGRPAQAGVRLVEFVAPEDREGLKALHAASRAGVSPEAEIRFPTAHGVETLALRASAQLDTEGRRLGCVFTGRPISELKRAYQALQQAHDDLQQAQTRLVEQEKMASLGRLVAGVAHELNNPISFIYANIHTLQRYMTPLGAFLDAARAGAEPEALAGLASRLRVDPIRADLAPLLEGTLEGAVRVTEIVKNLRRLSFAGPGERRPLDLARLVRTAATLTAGSRASRAEIDIESDGDMTVIGHEGQLHQVFVNLVDNALHAVRDRADGRVEIALTRREEYVEVAIADNGPGLDPAHADKVFEPFFTTKTVGEGTGLGLWISFSILSEHGGAISATNRSGSGAIFSVTLPADGSASRAPLPPVK